MGFNIRTACHKCKEQIMHLRGKENETIAPFYALHEKCMRLNPANVETKEDQLQAADWMDEYTELTSF